MLLELKHHTNTIMNPNEYTADYYENRKEFRYYKYLRCLLAITGCFADSICDVGSNGVDLISYLSCGKKVSIDPNNPLVAEGVITIKEDFLKYDGCEKFDIITCFQVIEHIDNASVKQFCIKLLDSAQMVIISVPYKWPKGLAEYHIQDPVDEDKLFSWFQMKPIFSDIIVDDYPRLIAIYVNNDYENKIEKINKCDSFGIDHYKMEYLSSVFYERFN